MMRPFKSKWVLAGLALALGLAGWLFLTERPLAVTVVEPETNVAIRIYGLGTV